MASGPEAAARAAAAGEAGTTTTGEEQPRERRRQPLEEPEDCPICFEAMTVFCFTRCLLTFCGACGQNLHRDCVARCQRASSPGECPRCHAAWREPSRIVAPGEALPPPAPAAAPPRRVERAGGSGGCLNLAAFASGRT